MADDIPAQSSTLSLDDFTSAIRGSWNKAIESVMETARMVQRAERTLSRKDLNALKQRLEQQRVMSGPTFSKLAKIAAHPVLSSPENLSLLPPSYATLYELAQHDAYEVEKALQQGKIHAAIKHRDVSSILPKRAPNRLTTRTGTRKITISVKFTAQVGDIPDNLITELHDVLTKIDTYTDVKLSGF